MRLLTDLLVRFRRDESGAFAIIFAVMAIVLVATAGATVDFTGVQQARTRAQVALDAAALALQPSIYTATTSTIQTNAQALLVNRLADAATTWGNCDTNLNKAPCAAVVLPTVDTTNGTLTLTANLQVPLNFVSLIGIQTMPAQIVSVATRKKLNLEVALVLDNSGSMGTAFGTGTRMTTLKASATCAANILFYGVTTCSTSTSGLTANGNVKMGLVPFNDEVNVGSGNANATWLDRTGGSNTFDNDNFDSDDYTATPYTTTTDRISLFSKIKDLSGNALSWGGCVEARVNNGGAKQYDTDDTVPDISQPDTLFTPLFAPDNPDSGGYFNNYISDTPAVCNWTGSCSHGDLAVATTAPTTTTTVTVATVTTTNKNNQITAGPTTTTTTTTSTSTSSSTSSTYPSTFTSTMGTAQTGNNICSCPNGSPSTTVGPTTTTGSTTTSGPTVSGPTTTTTSTGTGNNKLTTTTVTTVTTSSTSTPSTTTTSTTTTCSGQTYTPIGLSAVVLQQRLCKYTGAAMTKVVKSGFGPNADCPASVVQPLTTNPATLTTAINSMVAAGNTNIQEGTAWGFRVLSPTAPFTEGNAYDNATSKVMIIMTDGENTYSSIGDMNGASLYAAYAYPYNNYNTGTVARGRMGAVGWADSQFEAQINSRLSTTCTNAKAAGVTVYTIGLATSATSDPTGNTTLLTNCASPTINGQAHAFFPTTATDLQQAFVDIANQLADLRLSQ